MTGGQVEDEFIERLQTFLRQYYDSRGDGDGRLDQLALSFPRDQTALTVDFADLYRFDHQIGDDFLTDPDRMIGLLEDALARYEFPDGMLADNADERPKVRLGGLEAIPDDRRFQVGDYTTADTGKLCCLEGQVAKVAQSKGYIVEASYECLRCGTYTYIPQDGGQQEPHECSGCERQGPFRLDVDDSVTEDWQLLRLQRPPENARGGASSNKIDVDVRGTDLINAVQPGDRVDMAVRLTSEPEDGDRPTFDLSAEARGVRQQESDYRDLDYDEYMDEIEALAATDNPIGEIVDSIKPSHQGDDHIKEAIALMMFGGVKKDIPDGSTIRPMAHVMLIGDPGTDKSGLLTYAKELTPRSTFTSGKNATSAGLTAAAVQSDFGDEGWTLEGGALVKSHRGLCAIDEFDKIPEEHREGVHEALSQGTVSPSKAGVSGVTLPAETTVLAAANPKYGRFDEYEDVADQFELSPTMMSRFDLIFTMRDEVDPEKDRQLAEHLTDRDEVGQRIAAGERVDGGTSNVEPAVSPDVLRHYIAYAREEVYPTMTPEAKQLVQDFYVETRRLGADEDSPIPITARKIEALTRLSEASARARLSESIEVQDAKRAIALARRSLEDVGIDPETGELDADVVETGHSKSQRDRVKVVRSIIEELEPRFELGAPIDEVLAACEEQDIDRDHARHEIQNLRRSGEIYEPESGHLRAS